MNKDVMQLLLMQDTLNDIRERILWAFLDDPALTLTLNRLGRSGFDRRNCYHKIVLYSIGEEGCLFEFWEYSTCVDTIEQPWTASMIDAINGQPKPASPSTIWTQE